MKLSIFHLFFWMIVGSIHAIAQVPTHHQKHLDQKITEEIRDKYLFVGDFHFNRARFHSKECKWGYLDENLQEVIPAQFDWAEDFDRQLAEVELKRGHTLINPQGEQVTPLCGYLYIEDHPKFYKVTCEKPNKSGLISKETLQSLGGFDMNYIYDLRNGYFKYHIGFRAGIIDSMGNRVTEAEYEELTSSTSADQIIPYFAVMKRKKWGIIDAKGNIIAPLEYADAEILAPSGLFGLQDRKSGRWGIMNKEGHWVIAPRLDYAQLTDATYGADLLVYQDDLGYHLYNHQGEELGQFSDGSHFYVLDNRIWVMDTGGYRYVLDKNGQPVSNAYFDINTFGKQLLEVQSENKMGLCMLNGEELIATAYDEIWMLKPGHIRLETDETYYYWNRSLEAPLGPFDMIFEVGDSLLAVKKAGGYNIYSMTAIDENTDLLQEFPYQDIEFLKYNDDLALKKDDKWGIYVRDKRNFMNLEADTILAIEQFIDNHQNSHQQIVYSKSNHWFILDKEYNPIQKLEQRPYQSYTINGQNYYAYTVSENMDSLLIGVISAKDQKTIIPPVHQHIQLTSNQHFILRKGDLYTTNYTFGLMNLAGEVILPFEYRDITIYSDVIFAYSINATRQQYFLPNGQPIEIPKNWNIDYLGFQDGLAIVKNEDYNSGAINLQGKVIIPFEYDNIYSLDGGVWEAHKGLNRYLFDRKGQWIECYRRKPLPLTRLFDSW